MEADNQTGSSNCIMNQEQVRMALQYNRSHRNSSRHKKSELHKLFLKRNFRQSNKDISNYHNNSKINHRKCLTNDYSELLNLDKHFNDIRDVEIVRECTESQGELGKKRIIRNPRAVKLERSPLRRRTHHRKGRSVPKYRVIFTDRNIHLILVIKS